VCVTPRRQYKYIFLYNDVSGVLGGVCTILVAVVVVVVVVVAVVMLFGCAMVWKRKFGNYCKSIVCFGLL